MKFSHIHSSGRYNRSPESLKRAFASYRENATLITFTEVEFKDREKVLHEVHGWKAFTGDHSNRNDAGIAWKDDAFELVYKENFLIPKSSMRRARKRPTDSIWATLVVLEDIKNNIFVVTVVHTPSDVQSDLSKHRRRTGRVISWLATCLKVRRRTKKVKRKHKAHGAMIVADWNINFKKKWARALIKSLFPGWKLTWKAMPKSGTLGHRVIDGTLIQGDMHVVRYAHLLPDDNSSDHRPYGETISI